MRIIPSMLTLLFLLCQALTPLSAQTNWNVAAGYLYSDFQGFRASVDMIQENKLHLSLLYTRHWKPSPETPEDYNNLAIFFGNGEPQVTMDVFSFQIGGSFTDKKKLRYTIRGGPALNTINEPTNFRKPGQLRLFGPNYSHDLSKTTVLAMVFSPRVEALFSRHFGIGAGLYANINSRQPAYGISLDLLVGRLRD